VDISWHGHPELRDLANAPPEVIEKTNQSIGALLTRLLTENCRKEVRAIAKGERSKVMARAFDTLGQLAMRELVSNSSFAASASGWERYLDRAKIDAVMAEE
jgi:hypothetical protein